MSNIMDPMLAFKQLMPSTKIETNMEEIEITLNINDIANAIANQIKSGGYNCSYEVKDNNIVIKIKLGVRAG